MSRPAIPHTPVRPDAPSIDRARDPTRVTRNDIAIERRLTVNNFDLLRLVFAGMVVLFHLGILTQVAELAWLQHWVSGSFGLEGFFVVSGFLVTMSFDRSRDLSSYVRKRARRLAPAYIAVVLGAALGLLALSTLPWTSYFSDPAWRSYVFWNLLLANFVAPDLPGVFTGHYKQAINGSLWTIKIEVAFYCMVPVVAWLANRFGIWKLMAVLLVAALAWRIGFELLGRATGNTFWSKLAIQAPGQFSFFLAGAIAYHRTKLGYAPPHLWMAVAGVAAYASTDGLLHECLAPFAVGSVVYWAAIGAPHLGQASRHGDFSYGIYLYHWPIIQVFVALGLFAHSPVVAALGACMIVLALAIVSWYVLERRFLPSRGT